MSYNAPVHTHFPFLPGPPLLPLHPTPKKEEKKTTKFTMCCPYTHWNMVKFPSGQPLKDN